MGDLSTDARVPVRAYGHHRKEDCNDLELLIPFGPKDAASISRKVQALQPVGITPITGALEAAGQDFTGHEGQPNMIILVNEGKETCRGNPCAVARRLYGAGIQVQINVVGFDVTAEERQQLECIAEAGSRCSWPCTRPRSVPPGRSSRDARAAACIVKRSESPVRRSQPRIGG